MLSAQSQVPGFEAALGELCRIYWYPLYAYARRRLERTEDAQDLTQGFFAELVEKGHLRAVDPGRGKFRSFMLTAFKHFLSKERDRANAKKRGGGLLPIRFDFSLGESRYGLEPVDHTTPESLYERRWALTLLEQSLSQLRQEFANAGKQKLFEGLKETLTGDGSSKPYAALAADLEMSEPAVKVAVHRLRRRYRELLRAAIAQTVATTTGLSL